MCNSVASQPDAASCCSASTGGSSWGGDRANRRRGGRNHRRSGARRNLAPPPCAENDEYSYVSSDNAEARIARLESELSKLRASTADALQRAFAEEERLSSQLQLKDGLIASLESDLAESHEREDDLMDKYEAMKLRVQETASESSERLHVAEREAEEARAREKSWRKRYQEERRRRLSESREYSSAAESQHQTSLEVDSCALEDEHGDDDDAGSRRGGDSCGERNSSNMLRSLARRSLTLFNGADALENALQDVAPEESDDEDYSVGEADYDSDDSDRAQDLRRGIRGRDAPPRRSRSHAEYDHGATRNANAGSRPGRRSLTNLVDLDDERSIVSSSSLGARSARTTVSDGYLLQNNHQKNDAKSNKSRSSLRSLLSVASRLNDELDGSDGHDYESHGGLLRSRMTMNQAA